jgi:hypothetical protein
MYKKVGVLMVTAREQTIMDYVLQAIKLYMNGSDYIGYLQTLKKEDMEEVYTECERLLGGVQVGN